MKKEGREYKQKCRKRDDSAVNKYVNYTTECYFSFFLFMFGIYQYVILLNFIIFCVICFLILSKLCLSVPNLVFII